MKLAGELLELASDQFSNHGCNDFELPSDWTEEEKLEFTTAMKKWNNCGGDLTEEDKEEAVQATKCTQDWFVMGFLASELGYKK